MKKIIKYFLIIITILIISLLIINYYIKISTKNKIINNINNISDIDCILILGAGLRSNNPSPMLEDRLLTGIYLYNIKASDKIIMSGDHTRENHDEVNIMKDYAIEKGIPSEDIFMDHAGISTYDSIYRAKYIFNAKKIIIVSQEYHLYRALYIAKQIGLEAYGYAAEKKSYYGDNYRELREFLARNKDFIKCIYKPQSTYLGKTYSLSGNGDDTNDK